MQRARWAPMMAAPVMSSSIGRSRRAAGGVAGPGVATGVAAVGAAAGFDEAVGVAVGAPGFAFFSGRTLPFGGVAGVAFAGGFFGSLRFGGLADFGGLV